MGHSNSKFVPLGVAVLTVSDTRNESNDTSGDYFKIKAAEAGHIIKTKRIVIDDRYLIRAEVSNYIVDPAVQAVLITGGTGFTARDSTPEAIIPLLDKEVEGFGELFRHLSFQEIGTSTIQSRAISGIANGTVIFCVPGSTGACKTAWQGIIKQQLDGTHGPCNFVPHLSQSLLSACESREGC